MTVLLDVNVLMALLWENHEHHERTKRWLPSVTQFATCPVAQLGFVRISSHPLLGYGMSPEDAAQVLRSLFKDARHRFIADDVSFDDRILLTERMTSANQVTDHYLATLARQHGISLATLDAPLNASFQDEPGLVALIP